jgi:hypothetical protein
MEVVEGVLPDNLFELYAQCTVDNPQALLQRLLLPPGVEDNATFTEEQVHDMMEWLNVHVGLYPSHVGRFWFSNTLQRTRWEQLQVIEPYYTDELIETQLLPLIHKQVFRENGHHGRDQKRVSLRVLDWLVTNFSKKNRIIYTLHLPNGKTVPFNLYVQYKASLNRYKRHVFDPFRRHKRVYFIYKQHMYSTTVGQLNFMHWAFEHQIIQYAQSRMAEIEADMTQCIKDNQSDKESYKQRGTKRSRKPLCNITPRKCFVYSMEENVMFVQCAVKRK